MHLLGSAGYQVEDRHLTTRKETDAFKAAHGPPRRRSGYDNLRRFLVKRVADPKATTCVPVVALFGMTALIATALRTAVAAWGVGGHP